VGDVADICPWKVIGEEVVVLIGRTAAVKLDVASTGFLPEIGQFREVFTAHCHQRQLLDYCQCVNVLALHVLPLAGASLQVDVEQVGLIAEQELLIVKVDRSGHSHVFGFDGVEL
jgi:hypothetical protein